jgi:hypothetical protein
MGQLDSNVQSPTTSRVIAAGVCASEMPSCRRYKLHLKKQILGNQFFSLYRFKGWNETRPGAFKAMGQLTMTSTCIVQRVQPHRAPAPLARAWEVRLPTCRRYTLKLKAQILKPGFHVIGSRVELVE